MAQSLDRPLIDLDDAIESAAGKSIQEIFQDGGERLFRELESASLIEVPPTPPAIVSLGGGAILSKSNRQWIRRHGFCAWLDADAMTVGKRISGDASSATKRPRLTERGELDEIRQLLAEREPYYREVADCRVDTTGKTIDDVAKEILLLWETELRYK